MQWLSDIGRATVKATLLLTVEGVLQISLRDLSPTVAWILLLVVATVSIRKHPGTVVCLSSYHNSCYANLLMSIDGRRSRRSTFIDIGSTHLLKVTVEGLDRAYYIESISIPHTVCCETYMLVHLVEGCYASI